MCERQKLVLLASPTLRRGPLSALQRFVRDYEDFLRRYDIVTTEGCRRALLRSGLLHGHPEFKAALPGYLGGIVHLSGLVVSHRVAAVIYFIDPKDPSSIFPETNAIKRECVVHGVNFLSTSRAAREWANIWWTDPPPVFVDHKALAVLKLIRPIGTETIALIAHDGKKEDLLKFARDNFEFLLRFQKRVATGTTGKLLNGEIPDPIDKRLSEAECRVLEPICVALQNLIRAAQESGHLGSEKFVDEQASGPLGGDVMIANMVLDGSCQRIVFFENPLEPHEHTEDIQLLERTGRLRGRSTICIHNSSTATGFVNHWKALESNQRNQPLLLSFVLERLFGTRSILVETKGRPQETWANLRQAAGWFVLSHVAMLANERKRVSESVRVSVAWGIGTAQVAMEVESKLARLAELQNDPATSFDDDSDEEFGWGQRILSDIDFRFRRSSLADDRYFRPGNVFVAPIQGFVGSDNRDVEANEIAYRLKEFFHGKHLPLPANALVRKGEDRERNRRRFPEIYDHWSNTDIVLATAGPLLGPHDDRPQTTNYPQFDDEIQNSGSCGDIGGLYLDPRGKAIVLDKFERVGMAAEELKRVRAGGGTVIVSGAQLKRVDITLAALRGGWVSVLITDTAFASEIIARVLKLVGEGGLRILPPDTEGPLIESARF